MRLIFVLALGLAVPITGCESCARGRGRAGSSPVEAVSSAGPAAEGSAKDDPCRGLALPESDHYVAEGLCARVVAKHQGRLRQISFASNGVMFGVTTDGSIRRYADRNNDGVFEGDEIIEFARTGGDNGHNAELDEKGGYLYAGTKEGVRRWKWSLELARGGEAEDVVIGQPGGGNHPYHPVHVYDGFLYVDSGSEGNSMDPMPADYDRERSVIKRFNLASYVPGKPLQWKDGEVFVRGVRNVTGFTRTRAGKIYGVISGMDDLRYHGEDIHADNPGDAIALFEAGAAHGFPFCVPAVRVVVDGKVLSPGTMIHSEVVSQNPLSSGSKSNKTDAWCRDNSVAPIGVLQAHASSLSIEFFEGPDGALPARWKGGAFVALHGSWDREPPTGYKIVWVPFDADGRTKMATTTSSTTTFPYEVVFGGGTNGKHVDGAWGWSVGGDGEDVVRPIGVAISPVDGALYVSSDNKKVTLTSKGKGDGNIYRIGLRRK
jgi:glucose/arabinose dehydrogenase